MLIADTLPLIIGSVLGLVLLVIGLAIGMRVGKPKIIQRSSESLGDGDRQRVMELLQDLGSWTHEYSDNVSSYQDQLGQLSNSVRREAGASQSENRVVMLLSQIMNSNEQLQSRLEKAERQLEKQTRQIASYLSEARTDGLTGLHNRRAFDQRLEEMFAAYRRGGRSFALVLIDIDKFKTINDTHGHQAGDQVLQQLAAELRTQLNDSIMVARFGGEEFAAIMDGPLRIAGEKMNAFRKNISRHRMDAGTTQLEITISVGLSEPREDLVVAPVLRRADEALYTAKNIGRNRVYYHDGKAPKLVGAPEVAS